MVRIGILLTYPKHEMKKCELVPYKKGSMERPWIQDAPPELIAERKYLRQEPLRSDHPLGKMGIPTDACTGLYIRYAYKNKDVEVDFILPHEISLTRLRKNDLNFLLIYDLLEAFHTDKTPGKKLYQALRKCLAEAGNVYPPLEYQELIYSKIKYYNYLKEHDVSIAPTLTLTAEEYKKLGHDVAVSRMLAQIQAEDWGRFIAKPVYGQESIDLKFFDDGKRLGSYLKRAMRKYPGIVLQKAIKGFAQSEKCPELRMYYVGDQYKYTVSYMENRGALRAPTSEGGKLKAPMVLLHKTAAGVIKKLPHILMHNKVRLPRLLTRIDMGYVIDGKTQPFVNEVEFVPSLYSEDMLVSRMKDQLMDRELGTQMVKITRLYVKQMAAASKSVSRRGVASSSARKARRPSVKRSMKKTLRRNSL